MLLQNCVLVKIRKRYTSSTVQYAVAPQSLMLANSDVSGYVIHFLKELGSFALGSVFYNTLPHAKLSSKVWKTPACSKIFRIATKVYWDRSRVWYYQQRRVCDRVRLDSLKRFKLARVLVCKGISSFDVTLYKQHLGTKHSRRLRLMPSFASLPLPPPSHARAFRFSEFSQPLPTPRPRPSPAPLVPCVEAAMTVSCGHGS